LDPEARRELTLLEAVSEDGGHVTQRSLAARLGVALGLTNIYLKRLVRKGYIKCVNVQSNRLLYLITPAGIAEKTRLTYEYMQYSLQLYGQARQRLRTELSRRLIAGKSSVAIFGVGEAAELAYLCLRELSIEPVAIFDRQATGRLFLGMPVTELSLHGDTRFDLLVVATMSSPEPLVEMLGGYGVVRERLVFLREPEGVLLQSAHTPEH
jgi:DNA-binding MarR family transcriptional regulator